MEFRRRTYLITVEVDEGTTSRAFILDTIDRGLAKQHRLANGIEGVSFSIRILDDEGKPQGDHDPPKADNTVGD